MVARPWAYLMLSGSALFWSGNFVLGRAFAFDIPPLTFSYWRWLIALLVFLPFGLRALLADWPVIRQHLRWMILVGVLGVAGFNTFIYLGLQHTTVTNALLINSFIPILILLLTGIMRLGALSRMQLLGILISTLGMLMLVMRGDVQRLLSLTFNRGDLWILLAAFDWAIYSIALRWRPTGLSSSGFLLGSMIVGVTVMTPLVWLSGPAQPALLMDASKVFAILYVALFASIFAFLLWNQGIKQVGPAIGGQFIHLMPVFGAMMAMMFLGERLHWFHVVGAAATGCGIYLSLRSRESD